MRFLASVRQRLPAHFNGSLSTSTKKRRALVICTHMRPGRVKRRSSYVMQPISGLHVASLIDPQRFDVRLYHEDWHGPFNHFQAEKYDLVFLTGDSSPIFSGALEPKSWPAAAFARYFRSSRLSFSMPYVPVG
jgi:hypothetical protein